MDASTMLGWAGGKERTDAEYRALLGAAGFEPNSFRC
jgi:hypothetical protein